MRHLIAPLFYITPALANPFAPIGFQLQENDPMIIEHLQTALHQFEEEGTGRGTAVKVAETKTTLAVKFKVKSFRTDSRRSIFDHPIHGLAKVLTLTFLKKAVPSLEKTWQLLRSKKNPQFSGTLFVDSGGATQNYPFLCRVYSHSPGQYQILCDYDEKDGMSHSLNFTYRPLRKK